MKVQPLVNDMDIACVRIVPMRHHHDCVICCLAMLLGTSYEATLVAVSKVKKDAGTNGIYWTEAKKVAKQLNFKLMVHKGKKDWTELSGILAVEPTRCSKETQIHAVLMLRGLVVDPMHGEVWDDLDAYLAENKYKAGSLLIRKK